MKFKKIPDNTIANIIKNYQLSEELAQQIQPDMAPDEFLQLTADRELYTDAVAFMAHALPLRESIYWAFLTVSFLKDKFTDEISARIPGTVEAWFKSSDEANRRICGELADALQLKNGPAWLAEAVFWSGGSISSPKDPETQPPAFLYAKAVFGAVCLSISLDEEDPSVIKANFKKALRIAFNIAQGGDGKI